MNEKEDKGLPEEYLPSQNEWSETVFKPLEKGIQLHAANVYSYCADQIDSLKL